MEAAIIIGCILVLVLLGFIAKEFASIAEQKGYPGNKYFWWTFFTTIFGMLMVVALPDRGNREKPVSDDEIPYI